MQERDATCAKERKPNSCIRVQERDRENATSAVVERERFAVLHLIQSAPLNVRVQILSVFYYLRIDNNVTYYFAQMRKLRCLISRHRLLDSVCLSNLVNHLRWNSATAK